MSFLTNDGGVPGIRADIPSLTRDWLYTASASPNNSPPVYLAGGGVIDGSLARDLLNTGNTTTLRPGLLMGKVTSSGKYANAIIGALTAAASAAATSITTDVATAAEVARRLGASGTLTLTGASTKTGTVLTETVTYSAVNTSTGVITCSAITNAYTIGSYIQPVDGSQVVKGGLDQVAVVILYSGVTQDTVMRKLAISAFAKTTQIINYPPDSTYTSLVAWLKTQLNNPAAGPGPFRFDDNF